MPKPARSFIDRMPRNPVNEPLSSQDLEYLTDRIVLSGHHDDSINEALIILMDEVQRVAFTNPVDLENVTGVVSRHAYYRLHHSEDRLQALISEVRGKLAQR
jgi:hypothetical protein